MDLFNRKKLKTIEDRLKAVEAGHIAITEHLRYITQSNLFLSKLLGSVTTEKQQIEARDEAEAMMGQGKKLMLKAAKGDEMVADELWKKYGGQDLRKMNRMQF